MQPFMQHADAENEKPKSLTQRVADGLASLPPWIPPKRGYEWIKRLGDIVLSLLALLVLSPLFALIMLVIWLDDPHGSPFYSSWRVGCGGKLFRFFKFRSMRIGAEDELTNLLVSNEADGPVFKMKDDPRITRVGRFLRKYSLDELPQLVNVFKGDMSIVGPRPPIPREVELYTTEQMRRLAIRPGLTCLWQVKPQRNSISFDEWVELDVQYILHRSVKMDLRLIVQTIGVMIVGEGI